MKRSIATIAFAAMVAAPRFVWAQSAADAEAFQESLAAYAAARYAVAAAGWEALAARGVWSAHLYYNLGNAYYREGKKAAAVLNYERALRLRPRDAATLHNLRLVQTTLADDLPAGEPFFVHAWLNAASSIASANTWAVWGWLAIWGSAAGVFFWLFAARRTAKQYGWYAALGLLAAGFGLLLLARYRYQSATAADGGVVFTAEAALKLAPDDQSETVFTLHEGTKVTLLDGLKGWQKVSLPNGEEGWLQNETITPIDRERHF